MIHLPSLIFHSLGISSKKYGFFLQTLMVSCNSIRFKVIDLAIRNFAIANLMKYLAGCGIYFLFPSSNCQNDLKLSFDYVSNFLKQRTHCTHIFSKRIPLSHLFIYIRREKRIRFSLLFISYLCMIFLPQRNYFWNVLSLNMPTSFYPLQKIIQSQSPSINHNSLLTLQWCIGVPKVQIYNTKNYI